MACASARETPGRRRRPAPDVGRALSPGESRNRVALRIIAAIAAVAGGLPPATGAWLGRRLGDVAFAVAGRRRRLALDNLRTAFPDLPVAARRRLGRRSFQHLGTIGVELSRLLARPLARTLEGITIEGLDHLEAVMASSGRAIAVTAHLGNWELLAVAHRLVGHPVTVVMRPLDSAVLDDLVARLRRRTGVEIVDKRRAVRPLLQALGRGHLVAILLDQNATRQEGVFVPFFGRSASTSRGLAVLAVRTRTPVLPIFTRREAPGRHRVVIQAPLLPPEVGSTEKAVVALTARCASTIETAIRETPEQWLWIHNRWRTRPVGEGTQPAR
jgi:KDO2-lipid IV(A) lauroyltransferase